MDSKNRSIADLIRTRGLLGSPTPRAPTPAGRGLLGISSFTSQSAALPPPGALSALAWYHSRRANNKSQHDFMVERLVLTQQAKLMKDIRADIPSCLQPEKIVWRSTNEGHIPDVTARYWNGRSVIFEVETSETIGIEHTREQCRLFSAYAHQHHHFFVMVVPSGEEWRGEAQLRAWNIVGTVEGI